MTEPANASSVAAERALDGVPVPKASGLYSAIATWARGLVGSYYKVEVQGRAFPPDAPVVLVSNHTNGLADGALLMHVTRRPLRFLAKFKLLSMPVLGWLIRKTGAVPVYRKKDNVDTALNRDSFDAVYKALARREVIALFPEGSSHSEPRIQDLKTGAARLALGAEQERGFALGVLVQPVGFVYSDRDHFRSRVTAVLGAPLDARSYAGAYAADPWRAAEAVTAEIAQRLHELTIVLEDGSQRPWIVLAEELAPGSAPTRAERWVELAHGLAWLRTRSPERALDLQQRAEDLRSELAQARLRVSDVLTGDSLASRLRASVASLLGVPCLALGSALWFPPALVSRGIGLVARPTPDKLVTTQLLSAFVLFTPWAIGLPLFVGGRRGAAAGALVALLLALSAWWLRRVWPSRAALLAPLQRPFDPPGRSRQAMRVDLLALQRDLLALDRINQRAARRTQRP